VFDWRGKRPATQRRPRAWNGASIPIDRHHHWYAHSPPSHRFATSVGLTWRVGLPLACRGANRGAGPAPVLLGSGPAGLGAALGNDQRLFSERCTAGSLGPRRLLVHGFRLRLRQSQPDTNYASFCWFTTATRGVRRGGFSGGDGSGLRWPPARLDGLLGTRALELGDIGRRCVVPR